MKKGLYAVVACSLFIKISPQKIVFVPFFVLPLPPVTQLTAPYSANITSLYWLSSKSS